MAWVSCLAVLAAACGQTDAPGAAVPATAAPPAAALAAAAPSQDWPTYNGPLAGDRYSPLAQITTANVGQLRQVCAFDAPEAVNFQSGIVAVDGVLYFTLFNHTYAVDGATCQQKWTHTRPEPDTFLMVNRGVGYSDGRLFRGTGDAHVVAIDAARRHASSGTWRSAIRRRASRRRWRRSPGTDSCSPATPAATTSA